MNALNHMSGDVLAPLLLQGMATAFVLKNDYKTIQRALAALRSEEVKAAIEWSKSKNDAIERAKKKSGLDG